MDDEEINEREELTERFRQSLTLPLSERYFDEDELIAIFDDAGDMDDDYIRLEVLSVASRFYPDSEPLNQRRCLFYGQISEAAGDEVLEQFTGVKGPMWQLMRLRQIRNYPNVDFPKLLDKFLAPYEFFDDEEVVIQLIRLVAEVNQPEWLSQNIPQLIKKCDNEQVVLFEGAVAFETMHQYDKAAELLVRLTNLDPFGYSNWLLLAEQYLALGQDAEFNNAIEYALALDPNDWQGPYIKGKHLMTNPDDVEQASKYLADACSKQPTDFDPYRLYAYCLNYQGFKDKAEDVLREALKELPHDVLTIIPELIMYNPKDAWSLFAQYYRNNPGNSELFWRTWSDRLWEIGSFEMAKEAAECYYNQTGQRCLNLVTAEYYFRNGYSANEINELLLNYRQGMFDAREPIDYGTYFIIRVLSLAREGRFKSASIECITYFTLIKDFKANSINQKLKIESAKIILTQAMKLMSEHADATAFNNLILDNEV